MTPSQLNACANLLGAPWRATDHDGHHYLVNPDRYCGAAPEADLFYALLLKLEELGYEPSLWKFAGNEQWECALTKGSARLRAQGGATPLDALSSAVEAMG